MGCSLQALGRANTDSLSGPPLAALATLSFSGNIDLQRQAALAFAEITGGGVRHVEDETLSPILRLLDSRDAVVQEAACVALKNLAINGGYYSVQAWGRVLIPPSTDDNRPLIVNFGGLGPLTCLMLSPAIGVQRHAADCILALAMHGEN